MKFVRQKFLRMQKSLTITEKMDILKFFKFKIVFSLKDTIKKRKWQAADWEEIFTICKSDKGLIYKNIQETHKTKMLEKSSIDASPKEM